ncbi:MAG: MipA/OmpV family protein [Lautropia sp.]|nr:MipA/OmpV family protein [Lautropia sp.]
MKSFLVSGPSVSLVNDGHCFGWRSRGALPRGQALPGCRALLLSALMGMTGVFSAAAWAGSAALPTERQALPVWELGVGVSALTLADYRGADSRRRYVLPFPVLVYRAPHLKVDRGGIRADLWDDDRFELDLSVNVTPPVKRHATGIRAGMPGRKALLELGPRLQGLMWTGDQGRQRLKLHLPVRYAMPLGKLENAGLVFHPKLVLDVDHVGGWRGWQFSLAAGPIFANRAHHRYYYEVDPAYARPGRPAWAARGGYGGMQYTASFNKRFPDYWVAGFVRLDQVQGATFASSPLVRQRRQVSAGLVFGWLFARSAERVYQRD